MSNSTEGSRPLSAEEEQQFRKNLYGNDAGIVFYPPNIVRRLLATLDRERQHHDAVTQDRDDWKRATGQLKAHNERLAAQVESMRAVVEAAKLWARRDPNDSTLFSAVLSYLAQQERSRAESEARTGEGVDDG